MQLADKNAELSWLQAKPMKLTDKVRRVNWQNAAGASVSDDIKSIAGACKHPSKRAKMTHQSKDFSTALSTAASFALLPERDDFESCCKM